MTTQEIIQLADSLKMLVNREIQTDYYPLANATVEAKYNENTEVIDVFVRATSVVGFVKSISVYCYDLDQEIATTIDQIKSKLL
jgi:hypothetical protein